MEYRFEVRLHLKNIPRTRTKTFKEDDDRDVLRSHTKNSSPEEQLVTQCERKHLPFSLYSNQSSVIRTSGNAEHMYTLN